MENKQNYGRIISFAAEEDLITWLKIESRKKHESISNFIRQLIRKEMEKKVETN